MTYNHHVNNFRIKKICGKQNQHANRDGHEEIIKKYVIINNSYTTNKKK